MTGKEYTLLAKFAFYYFKIFCVSTVTFKIVVTKKGVQHWKFKYSKIGLVYNAFYTITSITSHYFSIKFLYQNDAQYRRVKFDKIFDSMQDILNLTTSIIISVTFCVCQDNLQHLLNSIVEIRRGLLNSDDSSTISKATKGIIRVFAIEFILWLALIATVVVYGIRYVPYFLGVYSSKFVISALLVQYTTVLKVIEECYKSMNNHISRMSNLSNCKDNIEKIVRLRKLHIKLTEVTTELSRFYSKSMLFCVFNTFSELICAAYFLVKPVVVNNTFLPFNRALHCFLYGIVYITLLMFLTKSATAVINESKKTGRILSIFLMRLKNKIIVEKLIYFSNYLSHTKIKFTVGNFFALDERLIMSIIGIITTYLVILLQIQPKILE